MSHIANKMDTTNEARVILHPKPEEIQNQLGAPVLVPVPSVESARRSLRVHERTKSKPTLKRKPLTGSLARQDSGKMPQLQQAQPKKLTQCRAEELRKFLRKFATNSSNYGRMVEETWLDEFIQQLKRRNSRTGDVSAFDVKHWLQNSEFAEFLKPTNAEVNPNAVTGVAPQKIKMEVDRVSIEPMVSAESLFPNLSTEMDTSSFGPVPKNGLKTEGKLQATTLPSSSSFQSNAATNDKKLIVSMIQSQQSQTNFPPEVDVFVKSGGFTVRIPPSPTYTTLLIQPTTWKAYKFHPDSENHASSLDPQTTRKDDQMKWSDPIVAGIKMEAPVPVPQMPEVFSPEDTPIESWHPLGEIPSGLEFPEYLTYCGVMADNGCQME